MVNSNQRITEVLNKLLEVQLHWSSHIHLEIKVDLSQVLARHEVNTDRGKKKIFITSNLMQQYYAIAKTLHIIFKFWR